MGFTPYYPPAYSSTYVKATSEEIAPWEAFTATNPSTSLTGVSYGNEWATVDLWPDPPDPQKFNVDLGEAKVVNTVRINNSHYEGGSVDYGIKTTRIYGTNSAAAFANTTYADTTDLTLLSADPITVAAHVLADQADYQYFSFPNTTAYRYYVVRIADNHDTVNCGNIGLRRIEFGYQDLPIGEVDLSGTGGGVADLSAGGMSLSGTAGGGGNLDLGAIDGSGVGGGVGGIALNNITAAGEGQVGSLLEVTGQLFQLQGGISLNSEAVAELSGKLFELKGGFQIDEIEVTGKLFELQGGFSIERAIPIELSGKLFELKGGVDVAVDVLVELGGQLFQLQGGMDAETAIPFEIGGQLFELKGTMTAVAIEPEVELSGQLFELKGGFTFAGAGECSGVLSYSPGGSC